MLVYRIKLHWSSVCCLRPIYCMVYRRRYYLWPQGGAVSLQLSRAVTKARIIWHLLLCLILTFLPQILNNTINTNTTARMLFIFVYRVCYLLRLSEYGLLIASKTSQVDSQRNPNLLNYLSIKLVYLCKSLFVPLNQFCGVKLQMWSLQTNWITNYHKLTC